MMRDDGAINARTRAMELAADGMWSAVAELLREHAGGIRGDAEAAALFGEALVRTGQAREAREWFDRVLPALGNSEEGPSLRRATMLAGAANFQLGRLDDAQRSFSDALDLAAAHDDPALVARAMNNLGLIANIQGKWGQALTLYKVAISAHQRLGDTRGLAESYHNMAITHRDQGQLDTADELEMRSIEFAGDAKLPLYATIASHGRAELALLRGDAKLARVSAQRVAEEFRAAGDAVNEAEAVRLAGRACLADGQLDKAREFLDFALERTRQFGAVLNEAETLKVRAELFLAAGDQTAAIDDARAALGLFRQLGADKDAALMLTWLSERSAE